LEIKSFNSQKTSTNNHSARWRAKEREVMLLKEEEK
jgi:hypothetical protein